MVLASIIPMACFLFPRSRRKVVYFAQDYDESYHTSLLLKGLVRCFYLIGLKLFRVSTIAVSQSLADLLRKRFRARVAVAGNGVDTRVFYPDPDPDLVAAKSNRRAVLLLSRNDRRKGFDIARDVVKRLSASHGDRVEVWTVGEPSAGLFHGLVHRDFGYVKEERLRRVMSSADVLLYPTRHEGFGLMPLEAMACGCPVVTTTAVPYAVQGENALVSEIGDSDTLTHHLLTLFKDGNMHIGLAEAGIKFAAKYSLSEATLKFEAVLVGMVPR